MLRVVICFIDNDKQGKMQSVHVSLLYVEIAQKIALLRALHLRALYPLNHR